MAINKIITSQSGIGQVHRETQALKNSNDNFLYINLDNLYKSDVAIGGDLTNKIQQFARESSLSMGILIDNEKEETEVSIREVLSAIEYFAHSANVTLITSKLPYLVSEGFLEC